MYLLHSSTPSQISTNQIKYQSQKKTSLLPTNKMFGRRSRTTTTRTSRPTLMTRLKGPNARHKTYKTEETVHHNGVGHHNHHGTTGTTTTTGTTSAGTMGTRRRNHHTTTNTAPAHHHRRRPSLGDKVSGAMMRMKGSLTRRPGEKVSHNSYRVRRIGRKLIE